MIISADAAQHHMLVCCGISGTFSVFATFRIGMGIGLGGMGMGDGMIGPGGLMTGTGSFPAWLFFLLGIFLSFLCFLVSCDSLRSQIPFLNRQTRMTPTANTSFHDLARLSRRTTEGAGFPVAPPAASKAVWHPVHERSDPWLGGARQPVLRQKPKGGRRMSHRSLLL
jgi:hypothetical protein